MGFIDTSTWKYLPIFYNVCRQIPTAEICKF